MRKILRKVIALPFLQTLIVLRFKIHASALDTASNHVLFFFVSNFF